MSIRSLFSSLILLIGLLPCLDYHAAAQTAQEITSATALTLIPSSSPEFDSLLKKHFAKIETLAGFDAAKPYLLLLRNDSGQSVWGYSVRLDYISKSELPTRPEYMEFLFDPYSASPSLDRNGQVFHAGEIRLIVPGFLIDSPAMYLSSLSTVRWALPLAPRSHLNQEAGEVTPFASVAVDAVVYANHHMAGPDSSALFEKYVARRDAVRDTRTKLSQMLEGSHSRKELASTFAESARSSLLVEQNPTSNTKRRYQQQYAMYAGLETGRIARLIRTKGLEAARLHLKQVLREPQEVNFVDN